MDFLRGSWFGERSVDKDNKVRRKSLDNRDRSVCTWEKDTKRVRGDAESEVKVFLHGRHIECIQAVKNAA